MNRTLRDHGRTLHRTLHRTLRRRPGLADGTTLVRRRPGVGRVLAARTMRRGLRSGGKTRQERDTCSQHDESHRPSPSDQRAGSSRGKPAGQGPKRTSRQGRHARGGESSLPCNAAAASRSQSRPGCWPPQEEGSARRPFLRPASARRRRVAHDTAQQVQRLGPLGEIRRRERLPQRQGGIGALLRHRPVAVGCGLVPELPGRGRGALQHRHRT